MAVVEMKQSLGWLRIASQYFCYDIIKTKSHPQLRFSWEEVRNAKKAGIYRNALNCSVTSPNQRYGLDGQWTDWFEGLTITLEDNGKTLFTGPVVNQAALHGLLKKVRDLGMPLVSVNRVKPSQADVSDIEQQIDQS